MHVQRSFICSQNPQKYNDSLSKIEILILWIIGKIPHFLILFFSQKSSNRILFRLISIWSNIHIHMHINMHIHFWQQILQNGWLAYTIPILASILALTGDNLVHAKQKYSSVIKFEPIKLNKPNYNNLIIRFTKISLP